MSSSSLQSDWYDPTIFAAGFYFRDNLIMP